MRPSVTLKLATSLDGRIATASGESKWITGEAARAEGHGLRAAHDAILVGVEAVLADDPELTVRFLPAREAVEGLPATTPPPPSRSQGERATSPSSWATGRRSPLRIVLDSRLRTPATAKVAATNTVIFTTSAPVPVGGAEVRQVAAENGRPAISTVLDALAADGIASILIEGGGQVAASFLRAGLVDRIEWFRAPILLGGEGRPCVAALDLAKLADAPKFRRLSVEAIGDDLWERYERI